MKNKNIIIAITLIFTCIVLVFSLVMIGDTGKLGVRDGVDIVEDGSTEIADKDYKIQTPPAEKPIGGERDEHGCLGPAGYTWCEAKQKCLRVWEDPCSIEDALRVYLKENLSELSFEKEVLGGSFYVTNLDILEGERAMVQYEDGHNAFRATFDYSVSDDLTVVQIDNFTNIPNDNVYDFGSCKSSGYEVVYPDCSGCPPYCVTPQGDKYIQNEAVSESICADNCGNGICESIVCMGSGCPCPETPDSCPADCE